MSPRLRLPLVFSVLLVLLLGACSTLGGYFGNEVSFSQSQLQKRLDRSFPREFDELGGLVTASLSQPRLTLPAGDDRLHLDFNIGVRAMGAGAVTQGRFGLASRLRYNPATRGLHLENPEIITIDLPGTGTLLKGGTRELLNAVLSDYAREVPVYRIDDDVLDRLPRGKQIGATRIEQGRIVVNLDER